VTERVLLHLISNLNSLVTSDDSGSESSCNRKTKRSWFSQLLEVKQCPSKDSLLDPASGFYRPNVPCIAQPTVLRTNMKVSFLDIYQDLTGSGCKVFHFKWLFKLNATHDTCLIWNNICNLVYHY